MGIQDRSYIREDEHGGWLGGRSMVINLILLNVAIYVADLVFDHRLSDIFSLKSDLFERPWQFWQLLTYGFLHDPHDLRHILYNMFGLWFFGSDVEGVYGRAEFLRFYLSAIILSGLVWAIATAASGGAGVLIGASGGIMGVTVLFVMHFPRRLIYIWGVLPVPAWVLGAIYVVFDVLGAASNSGNVAHVAHLAGAFYGFVYYRTRLNLGRLVPRRLSATLFRLRPRLRIHDPQEEQRDLNKSVDDILEKISREGEASLTKQERRTLEEASRRYQRRRE